MENWVCYPGDWQALFDEWANEYAECCTLAEAVQLGEHRVLALTVARRHHPHEFENRLLVAVPHGMEPAGTAACVDFACELLTGKHLDGDSSDLPRDEILDNLLITVMPDTNPQGRSRSPVTVWDGTHDNDYWQGVSFGIAQDGERFGRYPEWRFSEHDPQQVGIVYEQLSADIWAEPNTNRASTHCRMVDRLYHRYAHTHFLDLHQHAYDEAVILPAVFDELDEADQQQLTEWAEAILRAWRDMGLTPRPEPARPYPGTQREQYFRDFSAGRCPGMLRLSIEVLNNRKVKSGECAAAAEQCRRSRAAVVATVTHLLAGR